MNQSVQPLPLGQSHLQLPGVPETLNKDSVNTWNSGLTRVVPIQCPHLCHEIATSKGRTSAVPCLPLSPSRCSLLDMRAFSAIGESSHGTCCVWGHPHHSGLVRHHELLAAGKWDG